LVVEAAKRFSSVEFHLIGNGPLESRLLEVKKSETANVYLHDRVPLEKTPIYDVKWAKKQGNTQKDSTGT